MPTAIDRQQLIRLTDSQDAQIVDVLPASEYEQSHLPSAISIPLKQLTAETISGLSRDKPVVVYCHDGL